MICLMAHLVAHYPSKEESITIAEALKEGGAQYLEIQFPFSDPSADGPAIQIACHHALSKGGFTLAEGFEAVSQIHLRTSLPCFIMAYANSVFRQGVLSFVKKAADAGAQGLIIPDLPFDANAGLFEACATHNLEAVAVITPYISPQRLEHYRPHRYIYVALRRGTTGRQTTIDSSTLSFLDNLRSEERKIIAGFGIKTAHQFYALEGHADIAVIGTAFVSFINDHQHSLNPKSLSSFVQCFIDKSK